MLMFDGVDELVDRRLDDLRSLGLDAKRCDTTWQAGRQDCDYRLSITVCRWGRIRHRIIDATKRGSKAKHSVIACCILISRYVVYVRI